MNAGDARVFALPGNEDLAGFLARQPGFEAGTLQCRAFADGETRLRFLDPVENRDTVLVCTLDRPDDKLLRLYLAASTLRELGARRVLLLAPYLPYMRQDRAFAPGEGVSARQVAGLLSRSVDALVTVDPHLHRIASLDQIFSIPTRVVAAAPWLAGWIAREVREPLLIGPDAESAQWVSAVAATVGCPWRVLEKHRSGDREVRLDPVALGGESGRRQPVLIDDIIATGRTQIAAIRLLREQGFAAPLCVAVHAVFAGDAATALAAARRSS